MLASRVIASSSLVRRQCAATGAFLAQHKRTYFDTSDRKSALRALENPADVLSFYAQNSDMDTATLETALRCLSKLSVGPAHESIVGDERFHRLLASVSSRLEDADGRLLALIANALAHFKSTTPEMLELGQRLGEVVIRRENAFTPRNLATLALGFAVIGIRDPSVVEFVRIESTKLMQDFGPSDLHVVLEAYRRWGVFNRELTDLVVERMTDEIDRFTSKDIVETLNVISLVGLSRGFLIKRLCTIAFENLHQFDSRQLVNIMYSLTKLRFITAGNCDDMMDALAPSLDSLLPQQASQLACALAMVNYTAGEDTVRKMVDKFCKEAANKRMPYQTYADTAYAICFFQLYDKKAQLKDILTKLFEMPVTKNRLVLMKLWEVLVATELEVKGLGVEVPIQWRAACDECDRMEQDKTDTSRIHSEVTLQLDNVRGKYKLNWQKNQKAGRFYKVDLLDEDTKICLDLDVVTRPATRLMKHRHLKAEGYLPLCLDYWQWRRCRSEEDQTIFIKQLLTPYLEKVGRLEPPVPQKQPSPLAAKA